MSKGWTPDELQAASAAMKAAGQPSYKEFCADLECAHTVRVTLADGNTITTRINGTEEEIRAYYHVGAVLNVGTAHDRLVRISAVEIVADDEKCP